MNPTSKKIDRLSVIEYVNMFPFDKRNEVRRQIDLFKKKHGKYPTVNYRSLTIQLEENMVNLTSPQRRLLREDVGICNNCRKGNHKHCDKMAGSVGGDMVYCTCQCSGLETSLGAKGGFPKVPKKIRKEFRKFPKHEIDPLGHIF